MKTESQSAGSKNGSNHGELSVVQVPPVAFNLKDAAAYTGLSAWSLRVAYYGGELAAKRIGKTLIFTRATLDSFVLSAHDAEATNPNWLVKRRQSAQKLAGEGG